MKNTSTPLFYIERSNSLGAPVLSFSGDVSLVIELPENAPNSSEISWMEYVHPDDRESLSSALEQHVANGDTDYSHSYRIRLRSGIYRMINEFGRIVRNSEREVVSFNGYIYDLFVNIDDLYRQIPGFIYQYLLFPDGSSCFPFASENISYIYEVSPDEVKEDSSLVFARLHPEDLDRVYDSIINSKNNLTRWEEEYRVILPEKGERWLRGDAMPESLPDGSVLWHGYIFDNTENKKRQIEIERIKEQFELAVAGTNDGIWDWNINSGELFLSRQWKLMLGYEDHEVQNTFDAFVGLVYEEDLARVDNYVKRYLNGEIEKYAIEFRMKHKNGALVWILAKGEALRDSSGRPYRMAGSHSNISQRKYAEEKLMESEQNFRAFFESVDDMIFIANLDGKISFTNSSVVDKLGYERSELINMNLLDLHLEESRVDAENILSEMKSGGRATCPLPLVTKSGNIVPVETRIWFGKWGGEDCIFGLSKDLSKQEEVLQMFDKMFDSNPALMAVTSIDENRFIKVNQSFVDIMGYTKEEIYEASAEELNLFQDFDRYYNVESSFREKGYMRNVELHVRNKFGEILHGLFSGEVIESQGSKYFLSVMVDITERKKAEEILKIAKHEAEQSNKAKSEFLANMSHEIRTPMNSVIGFSELLKGTDLSKIQQEYVDTIISGGRALLGIINDILDFSKIEAGKLDLEVIETDVIDLIEQTVDFIKYPAGKKGIELLLDISPDIPRFAMVDPVRIRQILANLLSNALKFTDAGEIELRVTSGYTDYPKGFLRFSVRDTGIGISDNQKEKLFKAFSQADTSTTRKYGGTGLGLVISSQLVQKMGGTLQVDSVLGEGSDFFFSIETTLRDGEKLEASDISGIRRCLVIDDNVNNRTIMDHLLSKWGIDCITSENGFESLKLIENSDPFDLIICDYHMPYIDGLATIRMIREKLKLTPEKQPIILLHSSSDGEELQKSCKELGVYYRLIKPVKQSELLSYLRSIQNGFLKRPVVSSVRKDDKILQSSRKDSFKILVAEDNKINMVVATKLIKQILPSSVVLKAENGNIAFDSILRERPDLVLMDVQMPDLDGNDATIKLRQYEKENNLSRTIVIGLTAGALNHERERSMQSGMDDFLTKPIDVDKLKSVLERYLM